jgi:hypothetical protein
LRLAHVSGWCEPNNCSRLKQIGQKAARMHCTNEFMTGCGTAQNKHACVRHFAVVVFSTLKSCRFTS